MPVTCTNHIFPRGIDPLFNAFNGIQGMVVIERKPETPPETFLSRANGKTFEAVRRLLDGARQRPCISSSLLSDTEASALVFHHPSFPPYRICRDRWSTC